MQISIIFIILDLILIFKIFYWYRQVAIDGADRIFKVDDKKVLIEVNS